MKNYSLAPTDENAYEMLKANPIGRSDDVFRFVELLSHMENSCYSIALNGEWGSGKTFFVKQVKLILDAENPQSNLPEIMRLKVKGLIPNQFTCPDCYTTVYYDAWANDNHEDPLLSLIYEGRFHTFAPVTFLDRMNLTVIRPLVYMKEADVIGFVHKHDVPVVKSPCPADGHTRREYVKQLLRQLNLENPGVKDRMFTAVQSGLAEWRVHEKQ